ncbi:peptidoglycan bridge formation glycyltransferase FemA/FemB family protein [Candidatus Saccharibacteria bacterium]|nr:peptidoglycan bridge formation glycyltransferase FemA/FemB family protein [Candidatus Saccharibacteria bacterium]
MSVRQKTKEPLSDNQEWRKIIEEFPEANFLQSPEYGSMNQSLGNKVIMRDFGGKGHALMIVRNAKRGRYLEIPCGPLINWKEKSLAKKVIDEISEVAKQEKCVFVRIRPQLSSTPENLELLKNLGLRESPMHLAAEHTVIIDLSLSEEELLKNMRRQTRYEVRRAEKLGIKVSGDNSEKTFKEFHQVQLETAKRQSFVPPSLDVLMAEKKAFLNNANIYVAETAEGEKIAYGLIIKNGREADYYEAASTPLNRKLPGAYALLWQVIRDLKKEGFERFNLWGIAPAGQPNHRYAGVTTFKTGFGGEIVEYVPAHDLVISNFKYLKNLIVEKIRKKRRHL